MQINFKKTVQAINLLTTLEWGFVDKLKILKLIWLADKYSLRKYWRTILWDTYFAMKFWPVASWVKDILDQKTEYIEQISIEYITTYLNKKWNNVASAKEVDRQYFSDTDEEVIKKIFEYFWKFSGIKLVDVTHKYPEWAKFEPKLKSWEIIQAPMSYLDFFENVPNQDRIFDISEEHLELSKEMFQEDQNLERIFN